MNDKTALGITGIGGVVWLETVALVCGIDGGALALSFTVIGGICGYIYKGLRR